MAEITWQNQIKGGSFSQSCSLLRSLLPLQRKLRLGKVKLGME